MNLKKTFLALVLGSFSAVPALAADDVLTGDTRLACEAILCLATGSPPSECAASLARYFDISFRRWTDTLSGRIDFLNLCPVVSTDSQMGNLVNAIANGAGRCDASNLNQIYNIRFGGDGAREISNVMPSYCTTYATHAYTNLRNTLPKYIGTPERGGYWVKPSNYAKELKAYNDRIAAEDAAKAAQENAGGS